MVGNAADAEQVEHAGKSEQAARKQELDDLRLVMGDPAGRRVLWRLIGEAGTFASAFHRDPIQMAYYTGRQDLGHFLVGELGEASAKDWLVMQVEANKIQFDDEHHDPNPSPIRDE